MRRDRENNYLSFLSNIYIFPGLEETILISEMNKGTGCVQEYRQNGGQ